MWDGRSLKRTSTSTDHSRGQGHGLALSVHCLNKKPEKTDPCANTERAASESYVFMLAPSPSTPASLARFKPRVHTSGQL